VADQDDPVDLLLAQQVLERGLVISRSIVGSDSSTDGTSRSASACSYVFSMSVDDQGCARHV
jgi:hypothetical protein